MAVFLLLYFLQSVVPSNTHFTLFCDNMVTINSWAIGRSRNFHVNEQFKALFQLLQINHWSLRLKYIPSHLNQADPPSRGQPLSSSELPNFQLPSSLSSFLTRCSPTLLHTPLYQQHFSNSEIQTEPILPEQTLNSCDNYVFFS